VGPVVMNARTLAELAALCGAEVDGDGAILVEGPASLRDATPREISFYADARYRDDLERTQAAAVLVATREPCPRPGLALLRCAEPSAAFTRVVQAFASAEWQPVGQHASAVVDPSARLGPGVVLGPYVVIGPDCAVGARAVLHAGVVLQRGVRVGEDTVLHPKVVLYERVAIGARCVVHAGTVVGADGFGFEPTRQGWRKIPQCGTVVVEDDVELGANVTIDRARFGATRIGKGSKLDNLVHVAHNVQVGESTLLVAQVGIAGSTRIGPRSILAGQVGVAGHLELGADARVGGAAKVYKDVPARGEVFGAPAREKRAAMRQYAALERLPALLERVRALERQLASRADGGGVAERKEAR